MGRIVVGVDGSSGAALALRWALREGRVRGWSVAAVLVWDLLGQHAARPDAPFDPSYGEDKARAALDTYVAAALGPDATDQTVERQVICDLPARGLMEAAATADLLVVGARGRGGFRGLLLGSVSERCLHEATRPVVVLHETGRDPLAPIRRIVVGVDGSAAASEAVARALEAARAHGATVEAVHAWTLPALATEAFAALPVDAVALEAEARRILDEVLDAAGADGLPAPVVRTVVNGGAAGAILRAAESADMVVVGSRGRGGFVSRVLGSVSRQVVHHAPCAALVVPPTGRTGERAA